MEATTVKDRAYYRCRLTGSDYARNAALEASHPRSAYLPEKGLAEAVDVALRELFDPDRVEETVADLVAAGVPEGFDAQLEAAERRVRECEDKLAKYRAAIEAGTDPVLVGQWVREVQADKAAAEAALASLQPIGPPTVGEVRSLVAQFAGVVARLDTEAGKPEARAKLYRELGSSSRTHPAPRRCG